MDILSFELDRLESARYSRPLYRIIADEPMTIYDTTIPAGMRGGLIENINNINNSWISDGSVVVDNAIVNNCIVKENVYVSQESIINGNGHKLGGDMGPININDNVCLNLSQDINMGPITLKGDCILTGNHDILSLVGIFNRRLTNSELTVYKYKSSIYCYTKGMGKPCLLKELGTELANMQSSTEIPISIFTDDIELTKVISFSRSLSTMLKKYFS